MNARPRLGLTVGDPAGIGPEVVAAALRAIPFADVELVVYGDVEAVRKAGAKLANVATRVFASASVTPGRPDPAAARGVVEAIQPAARDCWPGTLDAIVTAPISKEVIADGGFAYPGHTELLEETCGAGHAVMLLVGRGLRVGLATIHCALREVPDRLSTPAIADVLAILHGDLERRFGLRAPRIAVCGLEPARRRRRALRRRGKRA